MDRREDMFIFFFSSRRRHTRFKCDWSSDVCSSDLPRALAQLQQPAAGADDAAPTAPQGPEQRVALVIGNSNYQNAVQLTNPGNDAQSMAQLLNSAGFEVISASDLTQNDM